MLYEIGYDRNSAVEYALKWALSRNPAYYDFEKLGGDCTNFVSQCLYAGCKSMNYRRDTGWYYNSLGDRAPAWTGVEFLRNFLLTNTGAGVYGVKTELKQLSAGDVIMLSDEGGRHYHSLIVSKAIGSNILVCSHSIDRLNAGLSQYIYHSATAIHILGARGHT